MKINKKTKIISLIALLIVVIVTPIICIVATSNKKVTISYQLSNSVAGTISTESEVVKLKQETKGATAVANTGYTFVNWTLNGNEVSKNATFVPTKKHNKNFKATYVANFSANKYKVTFVGNFNESTYSEQITQTYDSKYSLPTTNPTQEFYEFAGWYTDSEEGTLVDAETIVKITADQTLYAHWSESQCVAAGTLVTMRDGSMKPIEEIMCGDEVKVFDHETGLLSFSTVCDIWQSTATSNIFTLFFGDDIAITVVEEHGFYDVDENEYVFINLNNVNDFIGHKFYNGDLNSCVYLTGYENVDSTVEAYSITTSKHLNHMANGMLSMCDGAVKLIANIFEYNADMTINQENKDELISAHGLTSLEDVLAFGGWTEEDYYNYNLQYLSIIVGEGIVTWDDAQTFNDLFLLYEE